MNPVCGSCRTAVSGEYWKISKPEPPLDACLCQFCFLRVGELPFMRAKYERCFRLPPGVSQSRGRHRRATGGLGNYSNKGRYVHRSK